MSQMFYCPKFEKQIKISYALECCVHIISLMHYAIACPIHKRKCSLQQQE